MNVYQQMGIPQPQLKFTSSNPPTSSFYLQSRPLPAPSRPLPTPTPNNIISPSASSSPPKPVVSPSAPSSPSKPSPSVPSSPQKPPTISPSTSTPSEKKPNPVWKRTIPEVPPPVWGYAAGLVPDPHPKPAQTTLPTPPSPTKSTPISNKLKKKNIKSKLTTTNDKINRQLDHAIGYSSKQPYGQRFSQYPDQPPSRASAIVTAAAASAYPSSRVQEQTETEEETDEDDQDEEDTTDSADRFPHGHRHRRHYSHIGNSTRVGIHRREQTYYSYEEEEEDDDDDDTPKKKNPASAVEKKIVLRPKVKIDPYGGYEDVSPIGHGSRKKVRPRSETEDSTIDTRRTRNVSLDEDDDDSIGPTHRRAYSAIGERELFIAKNRNRSRYVESDYDPEEDQVHLAYDEDVRTRQDQDRAYRPQSQPHSKFMRGGRAPAAALPRPPPMIRDRAGGNAQLVSFSQAERKIRGGPRSALIQVVSEGEADGNPVQTRGGGWPGDLPRLPRTPGGGATDLDEPPPPPSIVRAPSPGAVNGYVLQKREIENQNRSRSAGFDQARRRFEVAGDERVQGQGRVSRAGYQSGPPPPPLHHHHHLAQQGRYTATPSPRKQQQTPAPPRPVGIESPWPLGGRDRTADMNRLEGSEDRELQGRRTADIRNVPKVMLRRDIDAPRPPPPPTTVSDISDRRRRPLPMPTHANGNTNRRPVIPHGLGSPTKQASPTPAPAPHPKSTSPIVDVKSNPSSNTDIQVFDVPGVYISKPEFDDDQDGGIAGVKINISGADDDDDDNRNQRPAPANSQYTSTPSVYAGPRANNNNNNGRGLICGGCHDPITHGRILSAMGLRWHPPCFKCTICGSLLEHVSSYEHDGKAYCNLDYHETFAPRCYSCQTAIIDEQFISLDDPALGKRTYHTQHFFCSECGDPFLDPSMALPTDAHGELALTGDGEFEGFTVYKGYPYCEACHVRLRLPKCKRCKKPIRDHEQAVEALGGKWCWACFVCGGCSKPFENPSFFQRGNQPYCEDCFSVMLRNEI